MRQRQLVPIFLAFFLVGCSPSLQGNPRAELQVAENAFAATVETLTDLRMANQIGDDEWLVIKDLTHETEKLFDKWHESVVVDGKRPVVADRAFYLLRKLSEWQLLKEK